MLVENKATGHKYEYTREQWVKLGKSQRLFKVISEKDAGAEEQHITNKAARRPDTGGTQSQDKQKTSTTTTRKK